eukprot:TRINITY_DN15822_c0_g1_i1.p1 TRINITY_DN15822_c0_g1~~TRINITY_DN15822_c0_g1_i1.p1  ORF type:complete len:205 (+),score=57.80 TRINITY_DN15822_c0_g1_i1:167-781(+)
MEEKQDTIEEPTNKSEEGAEGKLEGTQEEAGSQEQPNADNPDAAPAPMPEPFMRRVRRPIKKLEEPPKEEAKKLPPPPKKPSKDKEKLGNLPVLLKEIQGALSNVEATQGVQRLLVKIGIGAGECEMLYLGSPSHKTEYLPIGEALIQAVQSVNGASDGQVVASKESWELMKEHSSGETTDSCYYLIKESKKLGIANLLLNRFE